MLKIYTNVGNVILLILSNESNATYVFYYLNSRKNLLRIYLGSNFLATKVLLIFTFL